MGAGTRGLGQRIEADGTAASRPCAWCGAVSRAAARPSFPATSDRGPARADALAEASRTSIRGGCLQAAALDFLPARSPRLGHDFMPLTGALALDVIAKVGSFVEGWTRPRRPPPAGTDHVPAGRRSRQGFHRHRAWPRPPGMRLHQRPSTPQDAIRDLSQQPRPPQDPVAELPTPATVRARPGEGPPVSPAQPAPR